MSSPQQAIPDVKVQMEKGTLRLEIQRFSFLFLAFVCIVTIAALRYLSPVQTYGMDYLALGGMGCMSLYCAFALKLSDRLSAQQQHLLAQLGRELEEIKSRTPNTKDLHRQP